MLRRRRRDRITGSVSASPVDFAPVASALMSGFPASVISAVGVAPILAGGISFPPFGGTGGGGGTRWVLQHSGALAFSPDTATFTGPVNVGEFLSIAIGDGFGNGNAVTAVSDSAGNTYSIDLSANEPDNGGSIYIAHTVATNAINAGDTLTITFTPSPWGNFILAGSVIPTLATTLHLAGTPHGIYGPGSIDVTITPTAGDLLIAYAVYQHAPGAVSNDTGHGWTDFIGVWDPEDYLVGAYQVAGSGATVHYLTATTATDPGDGDFAAAGIVAYS